MDDSPDWDKNMRLQTKRDLETTERFHMIRAKWKKEDEKRKGKLKLDTTQASKHTVRSSPKDDDPRAPVNKTPTERFMAFSLIPEKTPEERQKEIDIANAIASKLAASLASPTTPQSVTFQQRKPSGQWHTSSSRQLPVAGAVLQATRGTQTDFDDTKKAPPFCIEQQHPHLEGLCRESTDQGHASVVPNAGPSSSRQPQVYSHPSSPPHEYSNYKHNWEYERDYRRQTYSRGILVRSRRDIDRQRKPWKYDTSGRDDILFRIMNHQMMKQNGAQTRKVSEGNLKMVVDAQESGSSLIPRADYVAVPMLELVPRSKDAPLPVLTSARLSAPVSEPARVSGPASTPARLLGPPPSLVSGPAPLNPLSILTDFTAIQRPSVTADEYSPQQPHFSQQKFQPQTIRYTYPAPHSNALGTPSLNRSSSSHSPEGKDRQRQKMTYPPPMRESLALLSTEKGDIIYPQYWNQQAPATASSYKPPIVENPQLPQQQSYGSFPTHQFGEQPINFSQFNSNAQSRDPRLRYQQYNF